MGNQVVGSPTRMALHCIKSTWPRGITSQSKLYHATQHLPLLCGCSRACSVISPGRNLFPCGQNPKPCVPPTAFRDSFLRFPVFTIAPFASQECSSESAQLLDGCRWGACPPGMCGKILSTCTKLLELSHYLEMPHGPFLEIRVSGSPSSYLKVVLVLPKTTSSTFEALQVFFLKVNY